MKKSEHCAAAGCINNASLNISLFRFPKDVERCRIWMQKIGRLDLLSETTENIFKNCRLCAEHFTPNMFTTTRMNRLLPDAMPTARTANSDIVEEKMNTKGVVIYDEEPNSAASFQMAVPEVQYNDVSQTCRGCLTKDAEKLEFLYDSITLDLFVQCTTLSVGTDDGLPNAICDRCVAACRYWFDFKEQCARSEQILREAAAAIEKSKRLTEENNLVTETILESDDEEDNVPLKIVAALSAPSNNYLCSTCDAVLNGDDYLTHNCHIFVKTEEENCEEDLIDCALDYMFDGEEIDEDDDDDEEDLDENDENYSDEEEKDDPSGDVMDDSDDDPVRSRNVRKKRDATVVDSNKPFACTHCKWRFSNLKRFNDHQIFHELVDVVKCIKCDITFPQTLNLAKHCRKEHPNERILNYACKVCGLAFASYDRLRVHASRHDGTKDKLCTQCGEMFILNSDLRIHILRKHTERPKIHKCDECHKIFDSVHRLKFHQKVVHIKERAFVCEICSKAFKRHAQLKCHILTHVEPIVCDMCGRNFKSDSAYKMHQPKCKGTNNAFRSTRKQVFKRPEASCPLCGTTCLNIRGLQEHLQDVHREQEGVNIQEILESVKIEKCKQCNKRYFDKFALRTHFNKVHNTKRLTCQFCHKMFRNHSTLKGHIAGIHKDQADCILENVEIDLKMDGSPKLDDG